MTRFGFSDSFAQKALRSGKKAKTRFDKLTAGKRVGDVILKGEFL